MHNLEATLQALPPDTTIHLRWTTDDTTVYETGTVLDDDPTVNCRQIATDDQRLVLTPTTNDEIVVSTHTSTGLKQLGCLQSIHCADRPTEQLRITDAGVEVPPFFVGYTGHLSVDTIDEDWSWFVPEPGLQRYDARLLAELGGAPPQRYHERTVRIRPAGGPVREFETVDERTTDTTTDGRYADLRAVIIAVHTLSETVFDDTTLEAQTRTRVTRELHELQASLLEAREILLEPAPTTTPWEADEDPTKSCAQYTETPEWLEDRLTHLSKLVTTDDDLSQHRRITAETALDRSDQLEIVSRFLKADPNTQAPTEGNQ